MDRMVRMDEMSVIQTNVYVLKIHTSTHTYITIIIFYIMYMC